MDEINKLTNEYNKFVSQLTTNYNRLAQIESNLIYYASKIEGMLKINNKLYSKADLENIIKKVRAAKRIINITLIPLARRKYYEKLRELRYGG